MVRNLLTFILIAISFSSLGQTRDRKSFQFLQVPNNARLSSLGGTNASLADRDLNLVYMNPALSGDSLAGVASVGYQFYIAGIGQATATYAHRFRRMGTFVFGVQHLGYGTIQGYDPAGAATSEYKSGETLLIISRSHQQNNFRFGASIKFAFSSIGGYRASAAMVDVGGLFKHPVEDFTVGVSVRNLGFIMSSYDGRSDRELPMEIQAGTTFRPEQMPLRFSLTIFGIGGPGVYYDARGADPEPGTLDKLLRCLNLGAEILVHRHVDLMVGYNYRIHQELKLQDAGGSAGITFGFAVRVRAFELVVARSTYVAGNAGYSFTLSKNIDQMLKRS